MEVASLSDYEDVAFGDTVVVLPTAPGSVVAIRAKPPYFSTTQSGEDVAWVEAEFGGRLVITPASHGGPDSAHYGDREVRALLRL
jgi:hypothetical protein